MFHVIGSGKCLHTNMLVSLQRMKASKALGSKIDFEQTLTIYGGHIGGCGHRCGGHFGAGSHRSGHIGT